MKRYRQPVYILISFAIVVTLETEVGLYHNEWCVRAGDATNSGSQLLASKQHPLQVSLRIFDHAILSAHSQVYEQAPLFFHSKCE